jgi:hypothetical protein
MRMFKKNTGERGVATILVVGVLVVFLIFFLVIAIDFAYIYVVRGQMQNAADAAALAGAAVLSSPGDKVQTAARDEAVKFAAKNSAAGETVVVVTDDSNVLSGGNDITVGLWDGTEYTRDAQPVNAVEVRPRRTEGSPGGPVGLFFGRLVDWPEMEVSRVAVATRPPAPTSATSLCIEACDPGVVPAGGAFFAFKEKKRSSRSRKRRSLFPISKRRLLLRNFNAKSRQNSDPTAASQGLSEERLTLRMFAASALPQIMPRLRRL